MDAEIVWMNAENESPRYRLVRIPYERSTWLKDDGAYYIEVESVDLMGKSKWSIVTITPTPMKIRILK